MDIFADVLGMIERRESGVLVTVVNAADSLQDFVGCRGIWLEDCQLRGDLCSLPSGWRPVLDLACQEAMGSTFIRSLLQSAEGWMELMLEPIVPGSRLIILGCGHVGQALGKMAQIAGWPITVVDDRPIFANEAIFPAGTKVVCDDFSRAIRSVGLGEEDYVVIVTRGHQYDRICLEELAGRKLAYVGMIGSKRRVHDLFAELAKEGVTQEWLDMVHSPIGLDIGAETPEEIAVSILAEMIEVRRKGAEK